MKLFRKTDFLVAAAVLVVAGGCWVFYQSRTAGVPASAEIYLGAEKQLTVQLEAGKEQSITLPERPEITLLLDTDGSIRFVTSDCPDKVCINTGKLRAPGQSAACLPNEVIVKIISRDGGGPDLIV